MNQNKNKFKHLLHLYNKVNIFLADSDSEQEPVADIVISFIIVVEKIFKIKLYNENPILIFDHQNLKNINMLVAVVCKKEKNINTLYAEDIFDRFGAMYPNIFDGSELQALKDIYRVRNSCMHSYLEDSLVLLDAQDVIKKMGTVWSKISNLIIEFFGRENIIINQPKIKYSKNQLENVLKEEVRAKLNVNLQRYENTYVVNFDPIKYEQVSNFEYCPRCGSSNFCLNNRSVNLFSQPMSTDFFPRSSITSELYMCGKCHLELTKKEYEIAKEIKNEI